LFDSVGFHPSFVGVYPYDHNGTFFEAQSRSLHPHYTRLHSPNNVWRTRVRYTPAG
jgi:hypothetical protein